MNSKCRVQIKKLLGNYRLLSVIYTVVIAIVVCSVFPILMSYDENAIKMIVSGRLSGIPNFHAININAFFGLILTKLYLAFPSIEWFSVAFALTAVLSCWLFENTVLKLVRSQRKYIIVISCLLSAFFYLSVFLEMTVYWRTSYATAVACLSALFFLGLDKNPGVPEYIVCALLLFLGLSFRKMAFYMIAPYIVLLVIFVAIKDSHEIKKIWFLLGTSVFLVLLAVADVHLYSDDYSDMLDMDSNRVKLQDYGGFPSYDDSFAEMGIDEEEYWVMSQGLYGLCDNFNSESLAVIGDFRDSLKPNLGIKKKLIDMRDLLLIWLRQYPYYIWVLLLTEGIAAIILSALSGKIINWIFMILTLGGWGLEWLYLAYTGRAPYRASYPLVITLIITALVYDILLFTSLRKNAAVYILFVIVALTALFGCGYEYYNTRDNFARVKLERYMLEHPDNTYLHFRKSSYDEIVLFNPPEYNYTKAIGWISETLDWNEFVRGDYDDIWDALAKREDLFFVSEEEENVMVGIIEDQLIKRGYSVIIEKDFIQFDDEKYWIFSLNQK